MIQTRQDFVQNVPGRSAGPQHGQNATGEKVETGCRTAVLPLECGRKRNRRRHIGLPKTGS